MLVALVFSSSSNPRDGSTVPVGKLKFAPAIVQPLKSMDTLVVLSSSTNSLPPAVGLYITSLITTGPTRGGAFAAPWPDRNSASVEGSSAPNVVLLSGTKSIRWLVA